jgi:beta-mannanase
MIRIPALLLLLTTLPVSAAYRTLEVPAEGAYAGAYCDFGDGEDHVTPEAPVKFQELTGKSLAIIGFGSFWARQSFPTEQVRMVCSYGAVPLIYWSPWDVPFDQNRGPDRFSLTSILAGTWDAYIDAWADEAAKVPCQFFVSFACEMNGTWFPWSGWYYGKGPRDPAPKAAPGSAPKKLVGADMDAPEKSWFGKGDIHDPSTWEGPETFKKAWRHVVDRVRARGATNVLWVFQPNNYSDPPGFLSWNQPAAYYPGPDYVDWLALSVYGKQTNGSEDDKWCSFGPLLDWPYTEMCALDPTKPLMLAEWGVMESRRPGESKGDWIAEAFRIMSDRSRYPRLKAAVFWHERWQNPDETYSNLRVNSSRASLKAYREGVASPFWLGRPVWKP